jgi:hypothetical protein
MIFTAANDPGRSKIAAHGARNVNRSEAVAMTLLAIFDQHGLAGANQAIEPGQAPFLRCLTEPRRPRLDDFPFKLGHPRRRSIGPGREWDDVGRDDFAIVEQLQRIERGILTLGRKAGDQVGADRDVTARGYGAASSA